MMRFLNEVFSQRDYGSGHSKLWRCNEIEN